MTATSFDRTAAWLGPRKWRLLHLIGGWYIWISFAVAVGKRVPLDSFYWPMAVLVLAIAVVRLIAMFRRGRRRVRLSRAAARRRCLRVASRDAIISLTARRARAALVTPAQSLLEFGTRETRWLG